MAVCWQTLTLAGFGCYRGTVQVEFSEGFNVCLGGNETGKSTLAAGIAAVIFGLQSSADPRAFSQGRFRNWHGPSCFEGMLTFTVNGGQYRIQRNFDNHRISLQRQSDTGWHELAGGEHNPIARKANIAYADSIRALLGLGSREIFYGTFFMAQPLPEEDALLPEVARLLSGGTHYQEALQALAAQVKEITRHTGRLGVTQQDMRQDRTLERLEKEVKETELAVAESARVLTELQQASAALAEAKGQLSQQNEELTAKENLLEAWQRWRTYRDRYNEAVLRQAGLSKAYEQAKALQAGIQEKKTRLETDYSRYLSLPEETGEILFTLSQLTEEENQLAVEEQKAVLALNSAESEVLQASRALDGFADVQGRETLPTQCRTLQKLLAEEQGILTAAETARTRLADLQQKQACLLPMEKLGKSPVQSVTDAKESAKTAAREWQEYVGNLERLSLLEEKLQKEYFLFEQANEDTLGLLHNYDSERVRLEAELARAQDHERRAMLSVEEAERARETYNRFYSDLSGLGEDGLQLVEEKLRLNDTAVAKSSSPKLVALLAALASAYGVYRFTGLFWAAGMSTLAVLALFAVWLRLWPANKERLHRVNALLGSHAAAGAAELGEMRLRLKQRSADLNHLKALEAELPDENTLSRYKAEQEAAEAALSRFQTKTKDFTTRFPNPGEALARWRDCTRDTLAVRSRASQFALRHGGEAVNVRVFDLPPEKMQPPWPQLARLADVFGFAGEAGTVKELAELLGRLDASWWQEAVTKAAEYEELLDAVRMAEAELSALTGESSETTVRLKRLREDIVGLREAVAPFNEHTNIAGLSEQLAACKLAQEQLFARQSEREQVLRTIADLAKKREVLQEKKAMPAKVAAPLLESGEPLESLTGSWKNAQNLTRLYEQEIKELSAVLRAHGKPSVEDLQAAAADAANGAVGILQSWEKLLEEYPSLPGLRQEDPSVLEKMYRQLMEDVSTLREKTASLEKAIRELEFTQARLQGQTPVNLAAATERLHSLNKRRARLQREATALQVAHHELNAAIHTYSQSYRRELAEKSSHYFRLITGVLERRITVDENFSVRINEDGRDSAVAQLSQGARDQLYIALRLAIADLLSAEIRLPFLFDDSFVNWDEERLENMYHALTTLSKNRQIILLSHSQDFAAWGKSCTIRQAGGES